MQLRVCNAAGVHALHVFFVALAAGLDEQNVQTLIDELKRERNACGARADDAQVRFETLPILKSGHVEEHVSILAVLGSAHRRQDMLLDLATEHIKSVPPSPELANTRRAEWS
jgi:hypothetical protein